MIQHLDKC